VHSLFEWRPVAAERHPKFGQAVEFPAPKTILHRMKQAMFVAALGRDLIWRKDR